MRVSRSMHVALPDLRAFRQGGLVVRYATLGPMAFMVVEVPESGSSGTSIEEMSRRPHWAIVIDGELTYEADDASVRVPAGNALYAPGGPEHRLRATGGTRIAAFQPVDPSVDTSDAVLADQGFELLGPSARGGSLPIVVPAPAAGASQPGMIDARTWSMPPYAMTTAQFGPASGYTADWCDAPHWGLVTSGQLVIEYEHDIELVSAGDVYYCASGAPAHRLEAADPATVVDLTPIDDFIANRRIAEWRRTALAQAVDQPRVAVSVTLS